MLIVTMTEAKSYLRIDHSDDDRILQMILNAAQSHVERLLGYRIADRYSPNGDSILIPAALEEAVLQLAACWYDNRGATAEKAREVPFGVREIVTEFREFTF